MKTTTALRLLKQVKKDCREAQAHCQLSQSVIQDFKHTVNWCNSVRKLIVLRGPEPKLTSDNKEVQDCLSVLARVRRDSHTASANCNEALQTLENAVQIINMSVACHFATTEDALRCGHGLGKSSQGISGWKPNDSVPGGWVCVTLPKERPTDNGHVIIDKTGA